MILRLKDTQASQGRLKTAEQSQNRIKSAQNTVIETEILTAPTPLYVAGLRFNDRRNSGYITLL